MLVAVDPLLHRIESLPEQGCYGVTFVLAGNQERSLVMKVTSDAGSPQVHVPEANLLPGWAASSKSFQAVLAAVLAVDQARGQADGAEAGLRDVPGGWDVSVGNVVLDDAGRPACVAHGELELTGASTYVCAECGAQAHYGSAANADMANSTAG